MRLFRLNSGGGKTRASENELPLCFVDRDGNRYTTAVAASNKDWWLGAVIIMNADHAERLRNERGPFTEVDPLTGERLLKDSER
jgi:hypothetical protein